MNLRHSTAFRCAAGLALLLAAGCQTVAVPAAETPINATEEILSETPSEPTPPAEETPAGVYALSELPYEAPDGAFSVRLPAGWNCSEPAQLQVDCQSPDGIAAISIRMTNTGYEITDDALATFAHAEMVRAYADVKEYSEGEVLEESGIITVEADWRMGETYLSGADRFVREGATVVGVRTQAARESESNFSEIIPGILESITIDPVVMRSYPMYAHRFDYTAPDLFFDLEIPTAWVKFADAGTVMNTVMEGFLSPDQRASVQVAVYRRGSVITQTLKAEKTLEIMRAYYGFDLRVSHDKALPDGRERLAWSAERKGISGISYFDAYGGSLYVFSVVWEEPTEDIYLPVLEEIQESFKRN